MPFARRALRSGRLRETPRLVLRLKGLEVVWMRASSGSFAKLRKPAGSWMANAEEDGECREVAKGQFRTMQYAILKPGEGPGDDPVRKGQCAMAIMAKAPRTGKVKTRLVPPLTLEESAALNVCFLKDTAENLASLSSAAGLICYTPVGDEEAFDDLLPGGFVLIGQRGDAFGERLLAAAEDILACGYSAVCLIDSDSPSVPAAAFQAAIAALIQSGDRVVIGPSQDGGYYLIGLKQAHAAVFERITWSTSTVLAETIERAREAGIEVVLLPLWYDVDDAATLSIMCEELLDAKGPEFATVAGYPAPHTRAFLLERGVIAGV